MDDDNLKIMLEFQKIIKCINNEIAQNRGDKYYFSMEQILIHNSPTELYQILKNSSPTYYEIYKDSKYRNVLYLLDDYINKIYEYYDGLLFSEQKNFDKYVSYSKEDKPGINSYSIEDLEMDLNNISNTIGLLNEAIRLWYEIYQNKIIIAEFSDGEIQQFKIKEGELAHLFGIIWSSLKNNDQLKKMGIVIPDTKLTDEEKYEILLKIVELNKKGNILQYEQDRLKKMLSGNFVYKVAEIDQKFDFYRRQEALLPYPKINVRTKAFIDYDPLDKLSLLLDFKEGVEIIKKGNDNIKSTLLLSKNNYSDKFNWTGIMSATDLSSGQNHMRSLLIKSPDEYENFIKKLSEPDGLGGFMAKESITTKIMLASESGGSSGETRIFTEEEQLMFISEILFDFNRISFKNIINYYNELLLKYGKRKKK